MKRSEIMNDLKALTYPAGLEPATVELWNHNVEYLEQETAFGLPALFVEFGQVDYRPEKGGCGSGTCELRLHLVTDLSVCTPLQAIDLADAVALAACSRPWCMCRTASLTNHNHEDLVEHVEVLRARVY